MRALSRVLRFIDSMNDKQGRFVSLFVLIVAAMFCWEVLLRGVFTAPTIWVHEGTQYFFGIYFMLGGAYALLHRSHVNVEIVYSRFSPRIRAIADIVTAILFFAFVGVMLYTGMQLAIKSVMQVEHSQTPWGPPIYPLKITLVVGAILVLLQGLAKLIRNVGIAIRGRECL